jgi:hypothetical protein
MTNLEIKAKRIDNVHQVLHNTQRGTWADQYWKTVLAALERDWRRSVIEKGHNA